VAADGREKHVSQLNTAAQDIAAAWPAEQAEEALRRIVTILLHTVGPMGVRELAILSLACDALGIDEPVVVADRISPQLSVVRPVPSLLAG
jgi:hypothetical protein